jgi:hypothetical protein
MAWLPWKSKQEMKETAGVSLAEMADLLLTIPELKEAYTRADIELALDDRGWLNPSGRVISEMDAQTRSTLVNKSRLYWGRDPMAKQAVRLWTDYALGTGITFQSEDDATQKKLQAFMRDRRNRKVMSSEGQRKSSKKLLVDGEVFFAIFTDGESKVIRWLIRCRLPTSFAILRTASTRWRTSELFRKLPELPRLSSTQIGLADDADKALAEQQTDPSTKVKIKLEQDVVIYHFPFDAINQRGNGLLSLPSIGRESTGDLWKLALPSRRL